jgi:putative spermidine/putrescine transport system substrate-binding protein
MDRRSFLRVAGSVGAAGAFGAILAACSRDDEQPADPAAPLSAAVSFAMYPGYKAIMEESVFNPYIQRNPGVSITAVEGPASQTYAQLLASSAGSRPVHGGMMNDALSWSGVKDGLWDQLTEQDAPNIAKVPSALRNEAGTAWAFNGFGISYNPEKMPNGVDSWKDLYSPSLRGRVAMWPAYFDAYLMAAIAEGADATEVEAGIEAWKKAKDNIGMWITSVADLHQAMDAGEIWAAPDYIGTTVRDAKAGMKLAMSIPAEGAVLNTYQMEVLTGISASERRVMAELTDAMLAEDFQKVIYEKQYLTPANGEVTVDPSIGQITGLESYSFTAADAVERFVKVDYKWVGENTSKIKQLIEDNLT